MLVCCPSSCLPLLAFFSSLVGLVLDPVPLACLPYRCLGSLPGLFLLFFCSACSALALLSACRQSGQEATSGTTWARTPGICCCGGSFSWQRPWCRGSSRRFLPLSVRLSSVRRRSVCRVSCPCPSSSCMSPAASKAPPRSGRVCSPSGRTKGPVPQIGCAARHFGGVLRCMSWLSCVMHW